jgi:ABC-type transport system involved in multi-copper enzyme maturation permease subunit
MLHATNEIIRFEARRTQTVGRLAIWFGLALVPSMLLFTLQAQTPDPLPRDVLAITSFYLVAQIGCMLGLLLWATPVVGAELESQTWIYIALRPHGKIATLFGKYVVASTWTATAGIVSAVGAAWASQYPEPLDLAICLAVLACVASLCYTALYMLIGIVFHARATVFAVVYTLIIEGVMSTIPATINKFTACYRLRSILAEWLELEVDDPQMRIFFGFEPMWQHFLWLAIYAACALALSMWLIRYKEFPVNSDM